MRLPIFPDGEAQQRAERQLTRYQILTEDYGEGDRVVEEWIEAQVGSGAEALGAPDLSGNTLQAGAVQLSTPGLYGLGEPVVRHEGGDETLPRLLSEAGYWQRMQWVQKMVVGLGDWVLRLDFSGGKLKVLNAYPWLVHTRCDPTDHASILELRCATWRMSPAGEMCWHWDCFELSPVLRYRIILPYNGEEMDVSNLHIRFSDGSAAPPGGLVGPDYPYRYADGAPFIPFVFYADMNDGHVWHDNSRRGATRGALNSITANTYMLRAMFAAAMPPAFAINLAKPATNVQNTTSAPGGVQSLSTIPGTILFTYTDPPEAQGQIVQLNNGANLQALQQSVSAYGKQQYARMGISADDLQQLNNGNPQSGSAMMLSRSAKRERAAMQAPFFRACDEQALAMAAALIRAAGGPVLPERGWRVTYRLIPLDPAEAQAQRDQDDWNLAHGLTTPVDIMLRENPGMTRAEAEAAIVEPEEEPESTEETEPPNAE